MLTITGHGLPVETDVEMREGTKLTMVRDGNELVVTQTFKNAIHKSEETRYGKDEFSDLMDFLSECLDVDADTGEMFSTSDQQGSKDGVNVITSED